MAEIKKRNKALSVNPLKSSQTIGAALAFLGLDRAIPMLHGSQGCTAFGKVFFVRHFREPIPLQTTAMDQVSTVMGANENVVEGLATICAKSNPDIIGLPTTGLSETQGADVRLCVSQFREKYPQYNDIAVIPVDTPDYTGCLETGYAKAVQALIDGLVEPVAEKSATRVNVLPGAHMTPGDVEAVKDIIERFGLDPVVIPDISGSLDGHLPDNDFNPITSGGTRLEDIKTAGSALATIVIGEALYGAADRLAGITGVQDYRMPHVMGLNATDDLIAFLLGISKQPVPNQIKRQRSQLLDAMLDAHFMTGQARIAIAADPDLLVGLSDLVVGLGAEVVSAVAPVGAKSLANVSCETVKVGDLEDLEAHAKETAAELLIGNSHCVQSAARLGVPVMRAGFPQFDIVGGFRKTWVGYGGARDAYFELANLMLSTHKGEVEPRASVYAQHTYQDDNQHSNQEALNHVHRTPSAGSGLLH